MDLKSAYRMVPIHPLDQPLLAVTWQGTTHVDTALPFELRSAPEIFSAVADTLAWAMVCNGMSGAIHYLDDFLFVATSQQATKNSLAIALKTCHALEFPVATDKTEGPATYLVFLGIQFDTRAGSLELPQRKLDQLHCLLQEWEGKRAPIKRDLLSQLGHLSHAASVIRPGRTFVRHLIDAASQTRALHHHVRLNARPMQGGPTVVDNLRPPVVWSSYLARGKRHLSGLCV